MKGVFYAIIGIVVISCIPQCSLTTRNQTQYYGVVNTTNSSLVVQIDLEAYPAFNSLVDRVEQIVCNDSIPAIRIGHEENDYLIGLSNICMNGVACALIHRRNVLTIQDDKIIVNRMVSIDSLAHYVSMHLTNYGELEHFSERPSKAMITILYSDNFKGMENILSVIVKSYDNLDMKTPLMITLDRIFMPPPTLPSI